jgi:DNA-binding CsgD family transcriptional regulator
MDPDRHGCDAMSHRHADLSSLTAQLAIYDTVTDPSRWKPTLDMLATTIGAVGAGLYMRRLDDRPYDFSAMSAAYDDVPLDDYMQRYAAFEAPQWEFLSRQPPLKLVLDDEAGVPRAVLDARPDYVVNRELIGIRRRVAFRLNEIPAWYDAAIFGFGLEIEDIPVRALDDLRLLLPHLAKAIEIGRAFATLRARYQAALAAIDRVHVGMGVALPSGEIIVHNSEMARILDCCDGMGLGRDHHLICRSPEQRRQIASAIHLAALTLRAEADRPSTLILIDRPSGRHPYLVEVTPLADKGGEVERNLAGALVVVIDPDNVPVPNVKRVAALFGLTPAETEICELLIQGATGPEIIERRGTSQQTVKAQIRAIKTKTRTHGRGDLIRTVLRTLPPVG